MKHFAQWTSLGMLLALSLACSFPLQIVPAAGSPSATPDGTLTAIYSMATVLTPEYSTSTTTPLPPTLTSTPTTPPPTETSTSTPTITQTSTLTATGTQTSTVTPPPTLTPGSIQPTTVYKRPEGYFHATYFSSSPSLDGLWDEWDTTAYPAWSVVYGGNQWEGESDLDGSFRLAWNEKYLFVAVKVKDDVYIQNATGQNLYKGDSLEILIDGDLSGDFYSTSLTADDYQLGISSGSPDPGSNEEAVLWFPRSIGGSRPQVKIAGTGGDGVWRVEAAIPWSVFGIHPQTGNLFGFALSISDNDNPDENVQQTMISGTAGRHLTNPTTWGSIYLGN